jgi:hypothetical protein
MVMGSEHAELVRALDPLEEDGAVARFLRSLHEELQTADEDRAKQLAAAMAALNANDENSLLSRLMRETQRARQALLHAINPDALDSPMAIMKSTMIAMLKEHTATQQEAMEAYRLRQENLDKEIREAITRLETRHQHDQKSPRGGLDFEEAVIRFVHEAVRGGPYVADVTSNAVGLRRACKVGDLVVRFTGETAFQGAAIVFEAKRDASYTTARALEELDTARNNRGACAGVFVMAQSHAPVGFPSFARFGSSILVTWDDEDPSRDPYLHAAALLALGLATRRKTVGDEGDLTALRDIEERVEAELSRLERMEKCNENIRRNSEAIGDDLRKAQDKLDLLLRKAKATLWAMNVELAEEGVERASPVVLAGLHPNLPAFIPRVRG